MAQNYLEELPVDLQLELSYRLAPKDVGTLCNLCPSLSQRYWQEQAYQLGIPRNIFLEEFPWTPEKRYLYYSGRHQHDSSTKKHYTTLLNAVSYPKLNKGLLLYLLTKYDSYRVPLLNRVFHDPEGLPFFLDNVSTPTWADSRDVTNALINKASISRFIHPMLVVHWDTVLLTLVTAKKVDLGAIRQLSGLVTREAIDRVLPYAKRNREKAALRSLCTIDA